MITFTIPKELVTPEELVVLTRIEEELKSFVQYLLNQKKSQAKVAIKFELVEKSDTTYSCESNSSFSIPDSIYIALKIKEYLARQSAELEVCLKKYSLKVSTSFRMPEDADAEQKNTKDSKEETLQFLPVKPKYNFSQIILSDKIREEVYSALRVIECKDLVYNTWGFAECDPVPRSVLNLYGEPGTGKTMCAHAIADRLHKTLLALNYAEIESKYVGEAPKNLQLAFDIAKKTDSVLFFDEADSFLGKRIQNVTQGAEQALNSLRSQMLILLEEHSGVVIFATNLVSNFDQAFESRILKHIRFELPNKEARVAIIKKMIPSRLPVLEPFSEEIFEKASEIIEGFSGREIKSAVLDMMLSKADISNPNIVFTPEDLFDVFEKRKEQKKQLKEEEDRILKNKILKKLSEKNEEAKMEKEMQEQNELTSNNDEAKPSDNEAVKE